MTNPQRPIALVTGGALRIGRALCLALGRDGFDVAVHYRQSAADAERLVAELTGLGARACAVAGDLSDPQIPAAIVAETRSSLGPVSVLVSNASLFDPSPLRELDAATLGALADAHYAIHVRAPLLLAHAVLSDMRAAGGGRIIHLADARSGARRSGFAAYAASKAGLHELTRVLAAELAPDVAVNTVAPGAVLPAVGSSADADDMLDGVPAGRAGSPDDVASVVRYLARAPLFVSGQCIEVDGAE